MPLAPASKAHIRFLESMQERCFNKTRVCSFLNSQANYTFNNFCEKGGTITVQDCVFFAGHSTGSNRQRLPSILKDHDVKCLFESYQIDIDCFRGANILYTQRIELVVNYKETCFANRAAPYNTPQEEKDSS